MKKKILKRILHLDVHVKCSTQTGIYYLEKRKKEKKKLKLVLCNFTNSSIEVLKDTGNSFSHTSLSYIISHHDVLITRLVVST